MPIIIVTSYSALNEDTHLIGVWEHSKRPEAERAAQLYCELTRRYIEDVRYTPCHLNSAAVQGELIG